MFQRIKDWFIKKLGGYTAASYKELQGYHSEAKEDLHTLSKEYATLSRAHRKLQELHIKLVEEYKDCRDILAGLEILKKKIETFRAEGAIPRIGRSEKQLKQRIEEKKNQLLLSLFNDVLAQGRFIVVDVNETPNKVELSATVSVLEGGVINVEDAQLPENAGAAGGTQEGDESQKDD